MAKKSTSKADAVASKSRSRTGSTVASKAGTAVKSSAGKKSPAATRSAGNARAKAAKGTPKAGVATRTKSRTRVTHEDISKRAYEIYLRREPHEGSPESDWLRAEEELFSDPGI
jgi:hypothetical protein